MSLRGPELPIHEPADRTRSVLVDLDDQPTFARCRPEVRKRQLLEMPGQALPPRRRIDGRKQRGQRTRLSLALELQRLRYAQVQLDGAADPCPVFDLAGDRALPGLAGN